MNRKYVSSSRIVSVGWENNTMEVEYKDGAVYQYYNVSLAEYNNFNGFSIIGFCPVSSG